ncbi:MAG: AAA family ATPase [Solirubrobacterales bacterium]
MIDTSITVKRVLSQRLGGCIFIGQSPDQKSLRVVAAANLLGAAPVLGEVWRVRGQFEDSKWGPQVRAVSLWRATPSGKLIGEWIAANVPGIGKTRVKRLMDAFGPRLVDLLSAGDPEPLVPVLAPNHPYLGARLASSAIGIWRDQQASADLHAWLDGHGVQAASVARKLAELLGSKGIETLETNPYTLVGLLPWAEVDQIGMRLTAATADQAHDPKLDARRMVGMVDAIVIECISETGDTALTARQLHERCKARLRSSLQSGAVPSAASEAIRLAALNHAVIADELADGTPIWRAPGCAMMETMLAERVIALISGNGRWRSTVTALNAEAGREHHLDTACRQEGIHLHPEQRQACLRVLGQPLAVLTGGAGTGKTTTTRAIVATWEAAGGRVELCALAGKAARRLGQSTHRMARTIHRLIRDLRRRQDDPTLPMIDADADVGFLDDRTLLVIDEASMVDLGQYTQLLVDYLPNGCHVVLVGDPAQLPPVGPGLVFPILCQLSPIVAELTVVHRQHGKSGIPLVSRAVREGEIPEFQAFDPFHPDGVSLIPCDATEMEYHVRRTVSALGGHGSSGHSLLVLAATNNGQPCSVAQLNRAFQAQHLRVSGASEEDILVGSFGQQFLVGDPVVFTRNLYQRGLCNGTLGRVVSLDVRERRLMIRWDDDEEGEIDGEQIADLQLAYALSCHKAQGSSAQRIVVPVYRSQVLDRAWVYTAITRAEEACVLVGEVEVLRKAITALPSSSRRLHGFRL